MGRVKVYEDPVTRQRLEGEAVVVRKIGRPDPEMGQRCIVNFVDDDPHTVVERWVALEDLGDR
jgi:hypothetical protein